MFNEHKIQEVMSGISLGDFKPSPKKMIKQRASTHIDDQALKIRWLELLLSNVSLRLKVVDTDDVDKLTKMADKLLAVDSSVVAVDTSKVL